METPPGEEKCQTQASTPATTPNSVLDEEKLLVPYQVRPKVKKKWYDASNVPFAILSVSVLQIFFHAFSPLYLEKLFRFEPSKLCQIWRFLTYMLVHDDWFHLILNVVIQCIFAVFLEKKQGHYRVLLLYFFGGITGVLGASCVHPDLVIGASAGVYALLISNAADIILNFFNIKYKVYRCISIAVLVAFDVVYNIVHVYTKNEPVISWEAHLVGGTTGLLLGFVFYKNRGSTEKSVRTKTINKVLFNTGTAPQRKTSGSNMSISANNKPIMYSAHVNKPSAHQVFIVDQGPAWDFEMFGASVYYNKCWYRKW